MHRVGRTGRFGTHGVAIAFVAPAELQRLRGFLQDVAGGQVRAADIDVEIDVLILCTVHADAPPISSPIAWLVAAVSATAITVFLTRTGLLAPRFLVTPDP